MTFKYLSLTLLLVFERRTWTSFVRVSNSPQIKTRRGWKYISISHFSFCILLKIEILFFWFWFGGNLNLEKKSKLIFFQNLQNFLEHLKISQTRVNTITWVYTITRYRSGLQVWQHIYVYEMGENKVIIWGWSIASSTGSLTLDSTLNALWQLWTRSIHQSIMIIRGHIIHIIHQYPYPLSKCWWPSWHWFLMAQYNSYIFLYIYINSWANWWLQKFLNEKLQHCWLL